MKHSLFIALSLITAFTLCRAQNKPEFLNKSQVEKLLKENQEKISHYDRGNFAVLSLADRNILLTAIAKEVILIHGPDYYRNYQVPDIQLTNITDRMLPDKSILKGKITLANLLISSPLSMIHSRNHK
jgi:hypothetical protein